MEANTGVFPIQDDTAAKIDDLPRWSWMWSISERRHVEIIWDISAGHCGKSWTIRCPPQNDLPPLAVCSVEVIKWKGRGGIAVREHLEHVNQSLNDLPRRVPPQLNDATRRLWAEMRWATSV